MAPAEVMMAWAAMAVGRLSATDTTTKAHPKAEREQHEDQGGDAEQQERCAPAEAVGDHAGGERPQTSPDVVGRAVHAIDLGADVDVVVVGEERVVGRLDHGPAEPGANASD